MHTLIIVGCGKTKRDHHQCQADVAGYVSRYGWPDRVVILAGKDYVEPLVGEHGTGLTVVEQIDQPMAGMGIGHRLQWLAAQTA